MRAASLWNVYLVSSHYTDPSIFSNCTRREVTPMKLNTTKWETTIGNEYERQLLISISLRCILFHLRSSFTRLTRHCPSSVQPLTAITNGISDSQWSEFVCPKIVAMMWAFNLTAASLAMSQFGYYWMPPLRSHPRKWPSWSIRAIVRP